MCFAECGHSELSQCTDICAAMFFSVGSSQSIYQTVMTEASQSSKVIPNFIKKRGKKRKLSPPLS